MLFRRFHSRVLISVCLMLAMLGNVPAESLGQNKPQTLYEAEAYLLYLFAMYTDWPREAFPDEKSPFVFGIIGKDPFGKDIDIIKGKTGRGRTLVVKYFARIHDLQNCHILFVSHSDKQH